MFSAEFAQNHHKQTDALRHFVIFIISRKSALRQEPSFGCHAKYKSLIVFAHFLHTVFHKLRISDVFHPQTLIVKKQTYFSFGKQKISLDKHKLL